jgi:DNA polymerase II small subunit
MEQELVSKKGIVNYFLKRGVLLSSDIIEQLSQIDIENLNKIIPQDKKSNLLVLSRDLNKILCKINSSDINWVELDKTKTLFEKGKNKENYRKFIEYLSTQEKQGGTKESSAGTLGSVKIIYSYNEDSKKRDIQDFVQYFNNRYRAIEKILKNRTELKNIISISRIKAKKDRDNISLIGLVKEKQVTKNKNIILTLEDPSGHIRVLANKNRPDLFKVARNTVLDEVIAVTGVNAENIVFANNIILPEIPTNKELKKSPDEAYALFLSDLHVGSNNFLAEDFNKFLKWVNQEAGNEKQKEIASKVKYIFIVGDLVDGCGVYPGQDKELLIKDIKQQYEECANLLKQIPKHISLIICSGNHDAMRIAEPQPPLYKEFAEPIHNLPNAILVSNPSLVNIHASETFQGFDVLLYHGYSFDFFVSEVDSLRNNGGYDRADLIMKFLLKRRHLAPTHTSTLYIPDTIKDPLVIEKVPDFFASGHIHKSIIANYRNVTMVCGSCWQSKTTFQEKVGHHPEPSRVPIINLKTREMKILKFGK